MSLLDYWDTQRSVKRRKVSGQAESNDARDQSPSPSEVAETPATDDSDTQIPNSQTDLESSLPVIDSNENAIEEYEASGADNTNSALHTRLRDGVWHRGKSSIYVDAFNLALETVLDEESHLFDQAEMEIFTQWWGLSYESQYL